MNKSTAIQIVKEYISKKEFSWEAIYLLDEEPEESGEYWIFRNIWEPRDSIRGNNICVDSLYPRIIVNKNSSIVQEISQEQTDKIFTPFRIDEIIIEKGKFGYPWGYAYEITSKIYDEETVFLLLDKFCEDKNLTKLGNLWVPIDFATASYFINKGLQFSIAFNTAENGCDAETVKRNQNALLKSFDELNNKGCFTNCFGDPWSGNYSSNPLTEQTFDVAIVIISQDKVLLVYFMDED
ncbi:hypothetical protein [Haliscomenobacter sp.]|uniref:hypothetical protein n=1 Tax=Haliscomenobacter sp. TaxID=2717303 RepID=UPI003593218B